MHLKKFSAVRTIPNHKDKIKPSSQATTLSAMKLPCQRDDVMENTKLFTLSLHI